MRYTGETTYDYLYPYLVHRDYGNDFAGDYGGHLFPEKGVRRNLQQNHFHNHDEQGRDINNHRLSPLYSAYSLFTYGYLFFGTFSVMPCCSSRQ